jgi:tetratricopeptide (TPR) repeat protein
MWLMYGYLQQDRKDAARRVLDACRTSATGQNGLVLRAPEEDPLDPDNIPAASYIQMWSRYIIDAEDWNGALVQEDLPLGNLVGATLTRAFVRALAAAKRSDRTALTVAVAELKRARAALDAFLATTAAERERYQRRAAVLEGEIRALTLLAGDRPEDGVAELRATAASEVAMPVEFGPPFVDEPTYELLGDVLLELGRRAEAASAYESALKAAPNRAAAVKGLARSR